MDSTGGKTRTELLLDRINGGQCPACDVIIKNAHVLNGPFCSNRCSMLFTDNAPLHLIHNVFYQYNKLKNDLP